jgi:hypothetical protein
MTVARPSKFLPSGKIAALALCAGVFAASPGLAQAVIRTTAHDVATPPVAETPAPKPLETVVDAAPLQSLDLFSPGAANTGLGPDLWKGASASLARKVFPALDPTRLEPALRGLARRVLSTGATAPDGAGNDADLAGERALALIRLGDTVAARAVLARTPGVSSHERLSRAAAESALWSGDLDGVCRVGESLAEGRDGGYWLRLRAVCLTLAAKSSEAQLALDLAAQSPDKDPGASRLVTALVMGAPASGLGSADSALAYTLSRKLKLELGGVVDRAPLPGLAALAGDEQAEAPLRRLAALRLSELQSDDRAVMEAVWALPLPEPPPAPKPAPVRKGRRAAAPPAPSRQDLADHAARNWQAANPGAPAAAPVLPNMAAALGANPPDPEIVEKLVSQKSTPANHAAADMLALWAAERGAKGQTALLALSVGLDRMSEGDRLLLVRALAQAGFSSDAAALAAAARP